MTWPENGFKNAERTGACKKQTAVSRTASDQRVVCYRCGKADVCRSGS